MGHSEMLLAVAGLEAEQIRQTTENLASGDWSDFTPSERVAFSFASKLTTAPATITDGDVQLLTETFGQPRALDLIWYIAWCNYMTRVADAFQLPLERTNVFAELQDRHADAVEQTSE
ncbi:MAG: carboxymuconolactone decarboxylase family protein [Pirellulaceae bacterium]